MLEGGRAEAHQLFALLPLTLRLTFFLVVTFPSLPLFSPPFAPLAFALPSRSSLVCTVARAVVLIFCTWGERRHTKRCHSFVFFLGAQQAWAGLVGCVCVCVNDTASPRGEIMDQPQPLQGHRAGH